MLVCWYRVFVTATTIESRRIGSDKYNRRESKITGAGVNKVKKHGEVIT